MNDYGLNDFTSDLARMNALMGMLIRSIKAPLPARFGGTGGTGASVGGGGFGAGVGVPGGGGSSSGSSGGTPAGTRTGGGTAAGGTVKTAQAFRARMEEFQTEVVKRGQDLQRLMLLELFQRLVMATPVGDQRKWARNIARMAKGLPALPKNYVGGTARRGWQINTGPATIPGNPIDSVMAQQIAAQSLITNPVPYIERLNQGHSKQAPAGFIQRAIAEVLAKYPPGGKV